MDILNNTDYVVTIAFLIFVGILLWVGLPRIIGGFLDQRADKIRADIDEARKLREEAQSLLASYERKQEEIKDQSKRIIATAQEEARTAAEEAKADLERSISRRLKAAEDQIASAEAAAMNEVRDRAVTVAIAAARSVIGSNLGDTDADKLIDQAISEVGAKLH